MYSSIAFLNKTEDPLLVTYPTVFDCECNHMYIINKTWSSTSRIQNTPMALRQDTRASLLLCLGTCLISDRHSASPPRKTVIRANVIFSCFARGYDIKYTQIMQHPTFFSSKTAFPGIPIAQQNLSSAARPIFVHLHAAIRFRF